MNFGACTGAPKLFATASQLSPAFKAPKPGQKPVYETLSLGDGDAGVLALSAVREDPNAATSRDADMRLQYAAQIASGEAQAYAAAARADAKITLNPKAID